MLGMFSSLLSAAIWLALATKYSLPVSTTQSVVGAIAGFALCYKGSGAIHWVGQYEDGKLVEFNGVVFIALFWVLSPFFAAVASILIFVPIRNCLLRKHDSYALILKWWPLFEFIVVFVMALFLLIKGLQRLEFEYEESLGLSFGITIAIASFVALIAWFIFVRSGMVDKSVTHWVESRQQHKHHHPVHTNGSSMRLNDTDDDEEEEPTPKQMPPKDSVVDYIESELKIKKPELEDAQSGALISVVQGLLSEQNENENANSEIGQSVQWHQWGSKRVIRRRVSALTTFFVTSVQAPLLMSFPVQG